MAADIIDLLIVANLAESRSVAKRLLAQGAIEIDREKVTNSLVEVREGMKIQVGKRRFVKIVDADKRT